VATGTRSAQPRGRISAASRQDYAAAAVTALLHDVGRHPTYELGGPAIGLPELARAISEVTGATWPIVTCRD